MFSIARKWSLSLPKNMMKHNRYYVSMDEVFGEDDDVDEIELAAKRLSNSLITCKKVKGKFVSPWAKETNKKLWDVLKLGMSPKKPKLNLQNVTDSKHLIKSVEVNRRKVRDDSQSHYSWLGHASCYVQTEGVYILTDPVWSDRASPISFMGPERYVRPPIELEDLKIDIVLLSHTHYDHLDVNSAKRIGNRAHWIVPLGVKDLLRTIGIDNVTELDWWNTYHHVAPTGSIMKIIFTPAKHWTSRTLWDRNKCLWGGFAVLGSKMKFYFTGDTAYCGTTFNMIGENFGPFDLAAIPIGAYSPRWFMKDVHCNPEEAVKIHKDLKSKKSFAIHWATFPLTDEDPIEPALELARARNLHNLSNDSFFTMAHGETLHMDELPNHDVATNRADLYIQYLQYLRNTPNAIE